MQDWAGRRAAPKAISCATRRAAPGPQSNDVLAALACERKQGPMKLRPSPLILMLLAVLLVVTQTGCGQRGDLYLRDDPSRRSVDDDA